MKELKIELTGVAPIMFHNERLADPTNKHTIELGKLTKQRGKTVALFEEIKWLEWRAGWYDHDDRPTIPANNILAVCVEGARKRKKGKDITAAVYETEPHYFLDYDGPRTISEMLNDHRFCDYRTVVISRRRTMRARPKLRQWSVKIGLMFDPDIVSQTDVLEAFTIAGERVGLCEMRPRLGRFTVKKL